MHTAAAAFIYKGCFNPAGAVGIDVSSALVGFGNCLLCTLFAVIGSALAVAIYWISPGEEI